LRCFDKTALFNFDEDFSQNSSYQVLKIFTIKIAFVDGQLKHCSSEERNLGTSPFLLVSSRFLIHGGWAFLSHDSSLDFTKPVLKFLGKFYDQNYDNNRN